MKNHVSISDTLYPQLGPNARDYFSLIREGGLTQYILDASFVIGHDAPPSHIQTSLRLFCGCAANALVGSTIPLKYTDSPGGLDWVITARSVEKLQDESEGAGGPCGAGGVGTCCPCSPEEDA